MIILLIGLLAAIFATSCTSATLVKSANFSSPFGPAETTDKANWGLVKYLDEGIDSIRADRRNAAYRLMYEDCNAKYKIIDESSKEEGLYFTSSKTTNYDQNRTGSDVTSQIRSEAHSSSYWYIKYQCL